jgi:hypothetical protein
MKTFCLLLGLVLLLPGPGCADAPQESYFVERAQIADAVLRDTRGVLTVGLVDAQADAGAYAGTPSAIPLYREAQDGFVRDGSLPAQEIAIPSGGEYDGMRWYRFPVTARRGVYLQLLCNLPQQRRCWVKPAELARPWSPHGRDAPQPLWFDEGGEATAVDLFFLSRDNQIRLYPRPDRAAAWQVITPASKALSSYGAYDPRALQLSEYKNGFGHLVEVGGCDAPPRSIGWVPLRDEKGLLLVWPIMGAGC